MDLLMQFWLTIRHSGWFEPSATGGIFPFLFTGQAGVIMAGFIAGIAASVVLHGEAAWLTRIILWVGYIAFGIATYEYRRRMAMRRSSTADIQGLAHDISKAARPPRTGLVLIP